MPLSSSNQEGTSTNRALNRLQYAIANVAADVTTAATGDKLLIVDVSDSYAIKYADGDNINEVMAGTTVPSRGAGLSAAETYAAGVETTGGLKVTRIMVDLTGLVGSATDLDIIGNTGGATSAHAGQITTAINGAIVGARVTCLEVPAGGATDIDFYSANESTGAQDGAVTALTETVLVTSGGAWTSGATKGMTTVPPANDYIYICNGAASGGTFTAGKFLIELFGV
jgi:hypothetical protein